MISLSKLQLRADLGKQKPILKRQYCETRDINVLNQLSDVTKQYNELMFEIYSNDNIEKAFELLGDDKYIIVDDVLIEKTENFIIFKDMTDDDVIKAFDKKYNKPIESEIVKPAPDNRSDDEIVYDFIQEYETNGLDCTKKFIESMLSGKISRARIGDTLTRLVMVGLNGKKLTMTDANDLTISDKVYKII